jgi:Fe-S cluster assembly ATP-binding protein
MLKIDKLSVKVENNEILKEIDITINNGDTVVILGPNGHGKSTLLKSIMNHYSFKISHGDIFYNDINITNMNTSEIAKLGFFLSSQSPIEINGITNIDFYNSLLKENSNEKVSIFESYKKINTYLEKVNFDKSILKRYINQGFSGGEKKKNEIMQMLLLNPKIIMLDEIDSGLDVDTYETIIDILLEEKEKGKTIIFITHNIKLIERLKPNKFFLIGNGKIIQTGDYETANETLKKGFNKYLNK